MGSALSLEGLSAGAIRLHPARLSFPRASDFLSLSQHQITKRLLSTQILALPFDVCCQGFKGGNEQHQRTQDNPWDEGAG